MSSERCPACGSADLMGKKFGFGDCAIHERKCNACDLFEWRNDRDPDYLTWVARWHDPPTGKVRPDRVASSARLMRT